jgi:hypothetical protein
VSAKTNLFILSFVLSQHIAEDSKQANRPIPRGVDKGPAPSATGSGSTSDRYFERFKPSPTISELEDVARQRSASSAMDGQDGSRRKRQPDKVGIFTAKEDTQAPHHSNVIHHGGTAGAGPYRAPPLPITGRDRDRVSTLDHERDRHKSYANTDTASSIPALSPSATYSPNYTAPVNVPVSTLIAPMKSFSFQDSGEQSSSSPAGWNGPSRSQASYARPGIPSHSVIRPIAANKLVSSDNSVQSSMSLHDRNGPSSIQDPYARRGVAQPPGSRPIISKKSASFDSGVQSSMGLNDQNGPSYIQNSYARCGVPPPSSSRPNLAKKSVSLDSGVQPSTSLNDQNGLSDIQGSYARHGVPLPSSSNKTIVTKKVASFDSGGSQFNSSREGWAGPSRLLYETHHESSHPQETPTEVSQSWQSSNRLDSQPDITSGSPYHPVRPTHTHHEVSEGQYRQTPNRSGYEAQHKEFEMRRDMEEEAKRTENEVKREGGPTRHVENSTRRFAGEERRLAQDQTFQVAKRQEDEVRRNVEEARLKGETTRAREEELRRKAEECTQWEELKDFTNKVERRSSYPDASGGFGDIWKGVLVDDHGRIVQVCTACDTCYRDI